MVTAPCTVESFDDTDFVRQALEQHLKSAGIPAGTPFHELPTADQSQVIRDAQALKITCSRCPGSSANCQICEGGAA